MKLYHGTNHAAWERIQREGITPRGSREGNWAHTVESHPELVYLTDVYSVYFCITSMGEEDTEGVILEIDADKLGEDRFYPDEDFVVHKVFGGGDMETLRGYNREVISRMDEFRYLAWESLERLGNIAYRGPIPVEAITRAVHFDSERDINLTMAAMDPVISVVNHMFMANKYREITDEVFARFNRLW